MMPAPQAMDPRLSAPAATASTPTAESEAAPASIESATRQRRDWLARLMRANAHVAMGLDALADRVGAWAWAAECRRLSVRSVLMEQELALSRDALCEHVPPTLAVLHEVAERLEAALQKLEALRADDPPAAMATTMSAVTAALHSIELMLVEINLVIGFDGALLEAQEPGG